MTSNQPFMPPNLRYYSCKKVSCQRRYPLGSELCLCSRGLNSHQCHDARKRNCNSLEQGCKGLGGCVGCGGGGGGVERGCGGKVEKVRHRHQSRGKYSRSITPSSQVLSTEGEENYDDKTEEREGVSSGSVSCVEKYSKE
jgi:hypothetical protein